MVVEVELNFPLPEKYKWEVGWLVQGRAGGNGGAAGCSDGNICPRQPLQKMALFNQWHTHRDTHTDTWHTHLFTHTHTSPVSQDGSIQPKMTYTLHTVDCTAACDGNTGSI